MSNQLVIYHGNCADGFSGAWVLKQHFQTTADKKNTQEFHAGVYQTPPPDVTGKDVVLVDFSYKRPVMEEIVAKANSVLVLDHHKTAEADLENLPGAEVVFDMDRAGSMIAWNYYFPNKTPPKLLEHIQDRDLWKFLLPGAREIQANVFSFPYDFAVWDRLMTSDPSCISERGRSY
jgi:oligoribonuclease NrnB/cAMP/cGMP phosphodiesterase (DHH superfamily)